MALVFSMLPVEALADVSGSPPAAPRGLAAAAGDGSVTLNWKDPVDLSITHYEYQMREAPPAAGWGRPQVVAGSDAKTTGFTVEGLTNGTEYRFKVWAVNANGAGRRAPVDDPWYVAATPEQQASIPPSPPPGPPPAPPTGLAAAAGDGSVSLSWDDPGDKSITRYEYRMRSWPGEGWGEWVVVPGSGTGRTGFTVEGLTNGTEYRFKVRGVNANGPARPRPSTTRGTWRPPRRPRRWEWTTTVTTTGTSRSPPWPSWTRCATTWTATGWRRRGTKRPTRRRSRTRRRAWAVRRAAARGTSCGRTSTSTPTATAWPTRGDRYWNGGEGWPPITGYDAEFDGNNDADPGGDGGPYAISNLYTGPVFGASAQSAPSVFGGLGANANVYNLSEDGARIASDNDSDNDGLIDVTTLAQLIAIQWDLNGDGTPESEATKYNNAFVSGVSGCPGSGCVGYELMNDLTITLNPTDAGTNHIIPGILNTTFEGNDNDITNQDARPLFQTIGQATGSTTAEVKNLKVSNTNSSGANSGILADKVEDKGKVTKVGVTGAVSLTIGASANEHAIGGLVNVVDGGTVINAYSHARVTVVTAASGTLSGHTVSVGGLVGHVKIGSVIASAYATGAVTMRANNNRNGGCN